MALPRAALRFPPECFGATVACLGAQVAVLAEELERVAGPLEWWVADVDTLAGHPPGGLGVQDTDFFGPSTTFVEWARGVDQFLSGVFMAVRPGTARAALRVQPRSEDDPWADLADEVFEVRAFDTSSIDVAASDATAAARLARRFGGTAYPASRSDRIMRVHDVRDPEGRIFAFEVSNVLLGRRGVRRVIGTIPNARIVRFSARAEEFCEFELDGTTFVAWEPWNDSSRYWIGAKPPHAGANLSTLRAAFERARPMFGFLLPARKEPARR